MEINQVIAQMRQMTIQAQGVQPTESTFQVEGSQKVAKSDFSEILAKSINAVNDMQMESGRLKTGFEMGDSSINISQVMIASQKSGIAFNAMVEVRNKLVDAYKDVMNMPV